MKPVHGLALSKWTELAFVYTSVCVLGEESEEIATGPETGS